MARKLIAQLLMIGAAAAAVAVAPTASADVDDVRGCITGSTCSDASPDYIAPESSFSDNIPKGWTNETQFIQPGNNPFGAGPQPPLLALE